MDISMKSLGLDKFWKQNRKQIGKLAVRKARSIAPFPYAMAGLAFGAGLVLGGLAILFGRAKAPEAKHPKSENAWSVSQKTQQSPVR